MEALKAVTDRAALKSTKRQAGNLKSQDYAIIWNSFNSAQQTFLTYLSLGRYFITTLRKKKFGSPITH